eukprot:jgi/Psemu1/257073/estExt_Genewise1Plus.C_2090059
MKTRKNRIQTSQNIILEFEDDQHLTDLIYAVKASNPCRNLFLEGQPENVKAIAEPLIKDSEKEYKLRRQASPHKIDSFISNRKSDDILVVYPFGAEKKQLEAAANGLKELSWRDSQESEQQDAVEAKSHYIEIRVEDYEKLDAGQWLNDSLVDLWMQWISRGMSTNQSSDVHFFTSHFYTTLASEGVEGVKSWTARKNINIFEKKLIFIPVNKSLHWSLCVIVNPGAIIPSVDDDDEGTGERDRPLPCMLFFDSLNMHRKDLVRKYLEKWLNYEWKRMKDPDLEPFNKHTCQIYDPQVPRQNNGSDCGVFVCRYAFAMFQLRELKFSYRDAGLDSISQDTSKKERRLLLSQAFSDLITNGEPFNFGVGDIQRIRCEFKTLIQELQPLYKEFKDGKIKAEREERKARKELRRKEKEEAAATSNTEKSPCESSNDSSDSGKENNDCADNVEAKIEKEAERLNDEESEVYRNKDSAGNEESKIEKPTERLDDEESEVCQNNDWVDNEQSKIGRTIERLDDEDSEVVYGPLTQEQMAEATNDEEREKSLNREEMAQAPDAIEYEMSSPLKRANETKVDKERTQTSEHEIEIDSRSDDNIVVI